MRGATHRRFNSYSGYFRRTFGGRVQKISVDAGFTCPNRDGKIGEGGCTFCNNGAFTPSYCIRGQKHRTADRRGDRIPRQALPCGVALPGLFPVFFEYLRPARKAQGALRRGARISRRGGYRHRDAPRLRGRREARLSGGDSARPLRGGRIRHRIDLATETLRAVNRGHDFACARRAVEMAAERGLARGGAFHPRAAGRDRRTCSLEQVATDQCHCR